MRITRGETSAGIRRGAALLMLLAVLTGIMPVRAGAGGDNEIDDITGETQETLAAAALEKRMGSDGDLEGVTIRQNGRIYGRGISDEPSGAEPDYIGLVGYAVAANNREINPETDGSVFPWTVPAYLLYSKRWYYTRPMQHKTGVLVIRQVLKDTGGGQYAGRLKIIRLDSGEICWMDVENFITVPYWFYPPRRAVKYGSVVAAYRREGNRLPTDENGVPAEVANDTDVLIPGNGAWDMRTSDSSRMIPGIVREERVTEENGQETRTVVSTVLLFPEEDLTIIY